MARKIFAGHDAALKSELKMTGQLLDSGLNIFRLFRRHWTGMTAIKEMKRHLAASSLSHRSALAKCAMIVS
jgi:hypothetical protein